MAVSIDSQAAIADIAKSLEGQSGVGDFIDDFRSGPTREFDASAWYGKDETYGTQGAWLTGEGLTDAWGTDPGWGMRSTYSNRAAEYLGEDPVANLFVDAQGMLQRGGKPSGWDYAALALSAVPVVGSAAVKMASPYVKGLLKTTADSPAWKINIAHRIGMAKFHRMQRKNAEAFDRRMSDYASESKEWMKEFKLESELSEKKMEVARQKMWKDLGDSVNKTPEEMEALRREGLKNLELKEQGIPTLEDAKTKSFRQKFDKAWDDEWSKLTKDLTPADELDTLVNEIREGRYPSFDETMKLSDAGWSTDEISQLLDESIQNSSLAKFLASPKLPAKSTLPTNVTQLPGTKPIQEMTWKEWDSLGDFPFTLSSKQNAMMRAQGITSADDVLDHFWGKGARKDFVDALGKQGANLFPEEFEEMLEFIRLRDLKSGYINEMTQKQIADDIAWKEIEIEAQKIAGTDPMIVAEKMAFKPDNVDHAEWVRLTKELSREETINLARRMTLRLID